MDVLLVIVGTFALCFGADKLYQKLFRSQTQHRSGLAVRLNKRYAAFGAILMAVGVAALFAGFSQGLILTIGGILVIVVGLGLVVYYATFGIFYDDEGFIVSGFGKKSVTYRYSEITGQQLYNSAGSILLVLVMKNGKGVQVQLAMEGAPEFLNRAYAGWLRQTGRKASDCSFHDPDNSCWFPAVEG